jgi:hypothetical protein
MAAQYCDASPIRAIDRAGRLSNAESGGVEQVVDHVGG